MKKHILVMLCLGFSNALWARPVSYPGGWTLMQMNAMDKHQLHVHYSPTAKDSFGIKSEYWSDQSLRFNGIQYNRLLKRWNQPQEQANFYFKSGFGLSASKRGTTPDNPWGYFVGLAADWETRRWFTSYENRLYDFQDNGRYFSQSARFGVAPYIGDYGDLHTWLMLQADHTPDETNEFTLTPLLRFFKGPYMLETGYSNRDQFLLNFIIRL